MPPIQVLAMPTIDYHALSDHLDRATAADWPPVTLICGEEMLCKKAFEDVLDVLMPASDRALGVETFDGNEDSLGSVLASMNTYALLSSAKVVVLHDARLFYSSKAQQGLREKDDSGCTKRGAEKGVPAVSELDGACRVDL
jgi:DNA polymerase-3 subunit delta